MATFARIPAVPGPVLEIFTGEELFPMHAAIAATWHPAPDGTREGYRYDGTAFTPPAPVAPNLAPAAKIALAESDITLMRCLEKGVSIPAEWTSYRAALRGIAGGSAATALPERPAYPAGS